MVSSHMQLYVDRPSLYFHIKYGHVKNLHLGYPISLDYSLKTLFVRTNVRFLYRWTYTMILFVVQNSHFEGRGFKIIFWESISQLKPSNCAKGNKPIAYLYTMYCLFPFTRLLKSN